KYCARNWSRGESGGGVALVARVLACCLSVLCTVIWVEPVAATSEAGMLAISRAALTNVVVRAAPFQSTAAPETKLPPSAVSVKRSEERRVGKGWRARGVGGGGGDKVQRTGCA